ncbi:MAG: N-acetyltransferase [Candidatus Azobacteroides sp.]|nr:N-acetyltransferase [Candidatus Azobacteroides sp.]
MKIIHTENMHDGIFNAVGKDLKVIGEMTYFWESNDMITIDRIDILPEYDRKEISTRLVLDAVDFARGKGLKIKSLSPLVASALCKMPDVQDLISAEV